MAKPIKFNLLIDGNKVSTFEELQDNLSAELLPHLPTGKLAKWFLSRDMADKAVAVQAIDSTQSDLAQLTALCEVLELEADEDILADILAMPEQLAQAQAAQIQETTAAPEVEEESYASKPSYREDWSGRDLSGRSFKGDDLSRYNFAGANLTGCKFYQANLEGANFEGANLTYVTFEYSNLNNANFTSCNLSNVRFEQDDINNSCFDSSFTDGNGSCIFYFPRLNGSSFNYVNMSVNFYGSEGFVGVLTNTSFKEAILRNNNFGNLGWMKVMNFCDLENADFYFADLSHFSFERNNINIDKAKFTGAIRQ